MENQSRKISWRSSWRRSWRRNLLRRFLKVTLYAAASDTTASSAADAAENGVGVLASAITDRREPRQPTHKNLRSHQLIFLFRIPSRARRKMRGAEFDMPKRTDRFFIYRQINGNGNLALIPRPVFIPTERFLIHKQINGNLGLIHRSAFNAWYHSKPISKPVCVIVINESFFNFVEWLHVDKFHRRQGIATEVLHAIETSIGYVNLYGTTQSGVDFCIAYDQKFPVLSPRI